MLFFQIVDSYDSSMTMHTHSQNAHKFDSNFPEFDRNLKKISKNFKKKFSFFFVKSTQIDSNLPKLAEICRNLAEFHPQL